LACALLAGVPILEFLLEHNPESIAAHKESGSLSLHVVCCNVYPNLIDNDPATLRISNNSGELPILYTKPARKVLVSTPSKALWSMAG